MPAWLQPGDIVTLPAWATGLTLEPGAYVVAALEGDDALLCQAGEDAAGDLVAVGEPVRIGWPELGYFAIVAGTRETGYYRRTI